MANKKTEQTRRIFQASAKSKAGIILGEKEVSIVGSSGNLIVVDDRGVTIKGPISMAVDNSMKRDAGMFIGMPTPLRMIPSTIITPIPPYQPMYPIGGIKNLAMDVAYFMAMLV